MNADAMQQNEELQEMVNTTAMARKFNEGQGQRVSCTFLYMRKGPSRLPQSGLSPNQGTDPTSV